MLSAIAARKAAQAAKQQAEPQIDGDEAQADAQRLSSPASSDSDLEPSPPLRKRKGQETEPSPKKRQKRKNRFTNTDIGRPRYFEPQQPIEGYDDDAFLQSEIPDNSAPTSRAYSPSQPIHDVELGLNEEDTTVDFESEAAGPNKGFSSSRPVPDSSEDEDQPRGISAISQGPGHVESFENSHPSPPRIFTPSIDSNTFRLTHSDLASLQVATDSEVSSATLILLTRGHSLPFVGAASITVLQGAITILGTPLSPSLHRHRVFSPRSSPLASLEVFQSHTGEAFASLLHPIHLNGGILPQRIQNAIQASDSVIVIQRLHTGIEGLGKIFRTFDGVFDVDSDVKEGEADDAIRIEGFHPVRAAHLYDLRPMRSDRVLFRSTRTCDPTHNFSLS
jgi:polynucleotide 5'-hydroxyl-kinase GRC3/NOL9